MTSPTVLSTVRTALKGADIEPWQRHLAFALASSMDDKPTASAAKELRLMMAELVGDAKTETVKDEVDDITARIAARRQASGS